MSRTIDQQVVEMQFDNRHFEQNVKTSMSTLERLKQSLNLTGASKGLENINAAARKNNISVLGQAAETVGVKFSAMQVAGITAIANITNSAVNAGKRIVKSLTIDPVTSGFHEYELKMGSIQTIMASTGESLETVNKYLNELNEYSDQTIYSFSDMTQNIGKFTNAGVKLEDAVLAIKGISNEAALSGANANEASRAMYNFAQALSAGYVKLIDWKSIENANMATVEFKNELIKTAAEMGTLGKMADGTYKVLTQNNMGSVMDQTISSTKNFNDSLNYQWMTTEVLIKTLGKYADMNTEIGRKATQAATEVKTFSQMMDALKESAQSGWAQTWEIIFGDFYEAKDLWTDVNNTIGKIIDAMSDARNNLLRSALGSSWEDVAEKIQEAGLSIEDFKKELKNTLKDNGKSVDKLEEQYGDLSVAIKAGEVSADEMRTTLGRIIKTEEEAVKSTGKVTLSVEALKKVADQVMGGAFGNGDKRIKELTKAGYDYAEIQNKVNEVLGSNVRHTSKLTEEQKKQVVTLANLTDAQRDNANLTDTQKKALDELKAAAKATGGTVNELIEDLSKPSGRMLLLDAFKNIWEEISKIFQAISDAWKNVFGEDISVNAGTGLRKLIEDFHEFSTALDVNETALSSFKAMLEAIFNVSSISFKVMGKSAMAVLTLVNALLGLVGTDILKLAEKAALKINDIANWLNNENLFGYAHYKNLAKVIEAVYNGIKKVAVEFFKLDKVKTVMNNIRDTFQNILGRDTLKGIADALGTSGIVETINSFFDNVAVTWVKDLNNSKNLVVDFLSGICTAFTFAADSIFDAARRIGDFIINAFASLTGLKVEHMINLLEAWHNFLGFIRKLGSLLVMVVSGLKEFVTTFYKLAPVQELLKTFQTRILDVWQVLKSTFAGNGSLSITTFTDKLKDAFAKLMEWVKKLEDVDASELGGHIISGLANGISSGIKLAVEAITNIATTIIETFKAIFDISSPSRVMITLAGFIISGLIVGLTQNKGALGTFVSNFGTSILEIFMGMFRSIINFAKELDFGKLVAIALSGGLIYTIKKLADALSLFGSPLAALTGMLKSIGGAFKGVGEAIKDAVKLRSKVEAIKGIAVALLILTGALWLMSKIKWQQLVGGTVILAALAGILFVLANACEKLNKIGEFGLTSASLLAISGAILALAIAFKLISTVKPEQMITTVIGFAGVCIALIQVMKGLAKVTSGCQGLNAKGLGSVFTKFAVGLLMMVGVIKLMSLLKMGEVLEATLTISLIAVLFRLYTSAFKGMDPTGIQQAGWFAIKMSTSLLLMMAVVKIASMFSIGEVLKGTAVIIVLGALFAGFMAMANIMSSTNAAKMQSVSSTGNMILKFATSLVLMSAAIRILGSMSVGELAKATLTVIALGALCAALTGISFLSGQHAHKAGLMLIEFSVALLIMSAVLIVLKNLDNEGLGRALGIVAGMTILFGALVGITYWAAAADKVKGTLITLTVAIGILAVALIALSLLDAKHVAVAGAVLTSVIGMFAVLIRSTSVISGSVKDLAKAIGTVILLTGIVVVLTFIIKELSTLEPERAIASAESIGVLLLAMSGSIWILNHSKGLTKDELVTAIIGMAYLSVIATMLGAVIAELKVADPNSAIAVAKAVGILLLAMGASFKLITMNDNPLSKDKCVRIAAILIELTLITALLAQLLADMDGLDVNKVIPNATAIGVLLVALSGALWIVSYSKEFHKDTIYKTAGILAEMAGIILLIAAAIALLDGISPKTAIGAATAIGLLLAALSGAFMIVSHNNRGLTEANMWKIAGVFAILTIILPVIGDVIATLANTAPDNAIGSAIALGVLIDALALAMVPLAEAGKFGKQAVTGALALTAMAIPLAVFAYTISNLPSVSEDNVGSIKALTQTMIAMTGMMIPLAILAKFTSATNIVEGVLGLSLMAVPLFVFGKTLEQLGNISDKSASIKALTQVMVAMTALLVPLTLLGAFVTATGGIGGLAIIAGIAALTAMIIPMKAFASELENLPDLSGNLDSIDKITSIIFKMGEMLVAISSYGLMAPIAVGCIHSVINIAKELVIFAGVIGGLIEWQPKLEGFVDKGINTLIKIGEGFGKAVVAFGNVILGALPGYAEDLSSFMEKAGGFIDTAKSLGKDDTVVTGARNIADAIIALVKAASKDFWSLGSMPALGEQLVGFLTDDVKKFFTDIGKIDSSAIEGAKNIAETILALVDATAQDAWNNIWTLGNNDWGKFGEKLAAFGTAMITFDEAIKGHTFDKTAIEAAKVAAGIMIELQQSLTPINSVVEAFSGRKDLGNFGTQLTDFGKGIRAFSDEVSNGKGGSALNKDAIQIAKDTGDLMVALQGSIAPVDGFVQAFTGSKNVATFGEQVKVFAEQLVLASNALSGKDANGKAVTLIDSVALEAASKAGTLFADLQKAIPEDKWLDGKVSLDEFGTTIYTYGQYLRLYSNELANVDADKVNQSTVWSRVLVDIAKQIAGIDTEKINNFESVKKIGESIKGYSDNVKDVDSAKVNSSITHINKLMVAINSMASLNASGIEKFQGALKTLGETNVDGIVEAFNVSSDKMFAAGANVITKIGEGMASRQTTLFTTATAVIKGLTTGLLSNASSFIKMGEVYVTNIGSGFVNRADRLNETAKTVAKLAAGDKGAKAAYDSFKTSGGYVVSGFANGISLKSYIATNAAKEMAKAAAQAAKSILKINSPSKVFMGIGSYVVEGFVKGIDNNVNSVISSTSDMADSARSGFSRAIGRMTDLLNGEMETQPTIRPVLDLSDVRSGAATIGSMFGNPSIGVMSNLGSINTMMNARNQNGSNADVVSAIDKLASLLGNTSGNTYQINGITYNDDTPIAEAVSALIRATVMEGRV